MNILITIKYDGTNFSGWQRQSNKRTVQGDIERVLSKLCKDKIELKGTSRTDAGVHAYMQKASFRSDFKIPIERLKIAANAMLDKDVCITDIKEVNNDFHARFSCVGKTYVYKILISEENNVFAQNYFYNIHEDLDVNLMKEGAKKFIGKKDFKSFMSSGSDVKETVRELYELEVREQFYEDILQEENKKKNKIILIKVTGNGFLYNMVRIIVGTLVNIGKGKIKPEDIGKIIESQNRTFTTHMAPPQGLYLQHIYFDEKELKESIKNDYE